MELTLTAIGKGKGGKLDVSETVFAKEYNESLIHQVVVAYMAKARAGTKAQKSRSDVRGGGRKPWAQKGTGRARSGTINSPIWRSGGVTFAARPRDYSQKVNKKMYRVAMCSILSELVRQERLIVVDSFSVKEPKTKEAVEKLKTLNLSNVLIVNDEIEENLYLATRNIQKVDICDTAHVDPVSLIAYDKILMTTAAVKQLEGLLA